MKPIYKCIKTCISIKFLNQNTETWSLQFMSVFRKVNISLNSSIYKHKAPINNLSKCFIFNSVPRRYVYINNHNFKHRENSKKSPIKISLHNTN